MKHFSSHHNPASSNGLLSSASLLTTFAYLLAFISSVMAQSNPPVYVPGPNDILLALNGASITLAAIAIGAGFIYVIAGYKLFRITLFLAGAYVGALLVFMLLARFQPEGGYPVASPYWLYVGTMIGVGFVFGLLFTCIWQLGLAAVGAVGGFFLATFIQSLKSGGLIQVEWGRIVFIVCMCLLGIIIIFFLERPVIIVCTSIAGAFAVFWGIDVFVQTGFLLTITNMMNSNFDPSKYTITGPVIGMMCGWAALAIVGIIFQWCMWKDGWRRPRKRDNGV